jgi:hypothetical protein
MQQGEIVIYKTTDNNEFQLEVRVEDETVWLTQAQMSELFQTTRNNITLHISNIFKEYELQENSVCKDSLLTANDGKKYKTKIYNLDVIISVGYRVKSKRGTQFRIWANAVLKDYLLKGYVLNQRLNQLEKTVNEHEEKFKFLIQSSTLPKEGIFYDGQIFDAYKFMAELVKKAKSSIVLIDNYIDENTLTLLSKRAANISAIIYTANTSKQLTLDLQQHNAQYPKIEIKQFTKAHDRFLIIDRETVYHIGASLKDLGKKWFAFSKINLDANEILSKIETSR